MQGQILENIDKFCTPDCNRLEFLKAYLHMRKIPYKEVALDNSRFIVIRFKDQNYNVKEFQQKILVAHYDRGNNTPGANDNSAAVIQLLELAVNIMPNGACHNTEIIFTDHEEIFGKTSIRDQGAYKLGLALKKQKITNCVFFDFDMCGVGNTIILSEAGEKLLESRHKTHISIYNQLKQLRNYTQNLLLHTNQGRFLNMRTPFSDNLGLILQGFSTMQITLLPFEEAVYYQLNINKLKTEIENWGNKIDRKYSHVFKKKYIEIQPETWKIRHTAADKVNTLSPEAFDIMGELLLGIVNLKIPIN